MACPLVGSGRRHLRRTVQVSDTFVQDIRVRQGSMLPAMGNREDLLAGAKRCLVEKGYAATTARDIAAASGVSLAAIGYHFGSKDALMNQAVYDSVGDWAMELQEALIAEGAAESAPLQ